MPLNSQTNCLYLAVTGVYLPVLLIYLGTPMYNKRQTGAENGGKEHLASNQVVGGSNPSGCANLIKHLAHFRKFESSNKNKNIKVVFQLAQA